MGITSIQSFLLDFSCFNSFLNNSLGIRRIIIFKNNWGFGGFLGLLLLFGTSTAHLPSVFSDLVLHSYRWVFSKCCSYFRLRCFKHMLHWDFIISAAAFASLLLCLGSAVSFVSDLLVSDSVAVFSFK